MITIITPFYNSRNTFERTFESVMMQSYRQYMWLIVDDGSCNEQINWLKDLCKHDERVRVICNSQSKGAGGARNTGLLRCNSAFVTFIDSDDTWDPSFLSTVVALLAAGVPAVTAGYRRKDFVGNNLGEFLPRRIVYVDQLSRGCDVSCLSSAYNLELCRELPLFGEVRARNDLYFVYNFLRQGLYILPLPVVLSTYHLGHSSISSNKFNLVAYMYQFSRFIGHGPVRSIFEVLCWAFYGIRKYWTRYFPNRLKKS